jgi:hypothetical protein
MDSGDSTIHHWKSLVEKARRGGWDDRHSGYDPILFTRAGIDSKALYRRIFQVPFLVALYGEEDTETGTYDKELNEVRLPRFWAISRNVHTMMMEQDHESVIAYLDSQETVWERERDASLPTQTEQAQEATE